MRLLYLRIACLACMGAVSVAVWVLEPLDPVVCAALMLLFVNSAYWIH